MTDTTDTMLEERLAKEIAGRLLGVERPRQAHQPIMLEGHARRRPRPPLPTLVSGA